MLLPVSESTSEAPGECVLWPPCHLELMPLLQPIHLGVMGLNADLVSAESVV